MRSVHSVRSTRPGARGAGVTPSAYTVGMEQNLSGTPSIEHDCRTSTRSGVQENGRSPR